MLTVSCVAIGKGTLTINGRMALRYGTVDGR